MSRQGPDPLERLSGFQAQQAQQGNAYMHEGISSIGQLGQLPERVANMQAAVLQRAGTEMKMRQLQQQMLSYGEELRIRQELARTRLMEAQTHRTIADLKVKDAEGEGYQTLAKTYGMEPFELESKDGKVISVGTLSFDAKGNARITKHNDEAHLQTYYDSLKRRGQYGKGQITQPKQTDWVEQFTKANDPMKLNFINKMLEELKPGDPKRKPYEEMLRRIQQMGILADNQMKQYIEEQGLGQGQPGQVMTPATAPGAGPQVAPEAVPGGINKFDEDLKAHRVRTGGK